MTNQIVDLVVRCTIGKALEELDQVLLAVEEEPSFGVVVQVPGLGLEFGERLQEF